MTITAAAGAAAVTVKFETGAADGAAAAAAAAADCGAAAHDDATDGSCRSILCTHPAPPPVAVAGDDRTAHTKSRDMSRDMQDDCNQRRALHEVWRVTCRQQ